MRIVERVEQVIKMRKIEGFTTDSKKLRTNESKDDFQLGGLSCASNLAIVSTTLMSLSKINIPLPLEFVYQYLLDSRLLTSLCQYPCNHYFLGGII